MMMQMMQRCSTLPSAVGSRRLGSTLMQLSSNDISNEARSTPNPNPQQVQPRLPYSVPRNTNGSLPVYTDIRTGGTRYLVVIRNVNGNITALKEDLLGSLFGDGTMEQRRMKVIESHGRHLTITGGKWKHVVMDWLLAKGF